MNKVRLMSVAVAMIAMASFSETASARWGWGSYGSYGSSYGSGGSYGSCGSSGYSSYYGSSGSSGYSSYYGSSGGSSGYHRGVFGRVRARHHARHSSYGSSGGSSGGYGVYRGYGSYGSSGSSGSSGGSVSYYSYGASSGGSSGGSVAYYGGSSGGSSGGSYYSSSVYSNHYATPVYGTPVYSTPAHIHSNNIIQSPAVTTESKSAVIDSGDVQGTSYRGRSASLDSTSAKLTMNVPTEAEIFVNGSKTRSTGTSRQFVSRGLEPGRSYGYEISVRMMVDGRMVTKEETVRLQGGEAKTLSVSSSASEPAVVSTPSTDSKSGSETALILNVPADAKVTLGGNVTKATGAKRVFRTNQLKLGDTWNHYTVHVAVERDGRTVTETKDISLAAGSNRELTFEFADASIAMR